MTCRTCLRIAHDLAVAIAEAIQHPRDYRLLMDYAAAVQVAGWKHVLTEHCPLTQTPHMA